MLIHVIDVSGIEGRDPVDDYYKIRKELEGYNPILADRRRSSRPTRSI